MDQWIVQRKLTQVYLSNMYGKRKYGQNKVATSTNEIVSPGAPTFVCSKCKVLKLQSTGYSDICITLEFKSNKQCRICASCSMLLEAWMNG